MKKSFNVFLGSLILIALISACASQTDLNQSPVADQPQEPVHIKVGVLNYLSYAPIYFAVEEGYFAEQGLEVELVNFGGASDEILPALIAKQLDVIGYPASVGLFNAILEGSNVKVVADKGFINPKNCITDAWVAGQSPLTEGAISSYETVAGKTVISPAGGTVEYTLDLLLSAGGLTQADIEVVTIADSAARIEALRNGSAQVSVLSEPWITRASEQDAGEVWVPFHELVPNMSFSLILYGPGILEDKPEAGTAFMIAYLQAVEQFNQGITDRNVELIAAFTQLEPEAIKASCWTSFKADGSVNPDSLLAFQDWALEKGYIDGSLELDQILTAEYLNSAVQELNGQ